MLNADKLKTIFVALGSQCDRPTEIIVCGGASMVLNYGSRESTRDVDCVYLEQRIRNHADVLSEELELECDWLNDDVCVTTSYSNQLLKYKRLHSTYGKLTVYTISGVPLLCMKLVSWRPNSSDYDDCISVLKALQVDVTYDCVMSCMSTIYGTTSLLSIEAQQFLQYQLGEDIYALDKESLKSMAYSVQSNLISLEDLPEEIKVQVIPYL